MDIDLDRLIKLIEERFGVIGKPITTAMTIMAVLAFFAVTISLVWKLAVWPLSRLISGFGWQATKEEILFNLLSLGTFILLCYVSFKLLDRFMTKKADKVFEKTKTLYDETVSIHNRTAEKIVAVEEKLEPVRKDLDEILKATGLSGADKEDFPSQ